MSTTTKFLQLAFLAVPLLLPGVTRAEGDHEHFEAHGGIGKESGGRRYEIVFLRDKVRVYVLDGQKKPIDPTGAEGTVQARFKERGRNAVNGTFKYVAAKDGQPAYLEAPFDMARTEEGGAAAVTIRLTKVPGGHDASFQEPFKLARLNHWACPMNCVAPSAQAGDCAKCKMALVQKWFIWACPKHPNVTSQQEGKCWVGKEDLAKKVSTGEGAHHPEAKPEGDHGHGGGGGHGDHKH
jgi:hypothetical protein